MTRNAFAALLLSASVLIAGSGVVRAQALVRVDGSSTVFPVTEAVAQAFQVRKRGMARITVGISGTTGGFRKFCRGETDLQDASRPILKSEIESCGAAGVQYVELPVAFDALTVAVSPRNTWVKSLTVADLRRIWEPAAQGKVVRWSDVNPSWPQEPLVLFGPDGDSGTFDYFTEVIVGTRGSSRSDYARSEDDNVIAHGISTNPNAIGYLPYAYFAANSRRLKAIPIDSGAGPVPPALENVANRTYAPLSRPLFIYVNARSASRPEVRTFMEFFFENGRRLIEETHYLPLSPEAYTMAAQNFRNRKYGTVFDGEPERGLAVEEILARDVRPQPALR
jgi:phosphate transport system substrate-binding protein